MIREALRLTRLPLPRKILGMSPSRPVPSPESFPLHTEVVVRFRDVDAMGHVNNAVYLTYLEEARVALFKELAPTDLHGPSPEQQFPFILAEATCRYLSPAAVAETLNVYIRVARTGSKSFDFEYLVTEQRSGRLLAAARTVQVAFDYATGQPIEIPPHLREALERFR
jgi:acyl-CoA thioester hydrolase